MITRYIDRSYISYFNLLIYDMDFKTCYLRLEEISNLIKNTTIIDIDQLVALQEEAKQLYDFLTKQLAEHND